MADGNLDSQPADSTDQPVAPRRAEGPLPVPVYGMPRYQLAQYDAAYEAVHDDLPWSGGLNFTAILTIFARKKKTIVIAVLAALLAGIFYIKGATKIYESETLMELSLRRPRILSQEDALINDSTRMPSTEQFNTQLLKLEGLALRKAVAEALFRALPADGREFDDFQDYVSKNVDLELLRRSSIVRITAQSSSPEEAAIIANTYARVAVESVIAVNREASESAVAWLQSQLPLQRVSLQKAEGALLAFREAHQLEALEAQRKTTEEALLRYNAELVDIDVKETLTRDMLALLNATASDYSNVGKLPSSVPRSAQLMQRLDDLTDAVGTRDAFLSRYTEKHPEVVAQDRVITAARKQLANEIDRARQNAKSDLDLLAKQKESLAWKKREEAALGAELERQSAHARARLNTLERDKEACEISYNGVLRRIQEARLSADEETASIAVIEPAHVPTTHSKPRSVLVLMFTLGLGLVAGAGLSLLTYKLEDRVWTAVDVTRDIGLKILGLVPHVDRADRSRLGAESFDDKFSAVAEAFAGIRGVLDSSFDNCRTFLVTSGSPEAGKTIASCNLATVFARSGKKVLLVDLDMRRPRLHRVYGITSIDADILGALGKPEEPDFSTLPQKTRVPDLDVVVSRRWRNISPAEALSSGRFRRFMDWAEANYDRVIIDSPPNEAVSDAMVVAPIVQGVIVVVRFNKSRKSVVRATVRRLQDVGGPLLGAIVNGVQFNRLGYSSAFKQYHTPYMYQYRTPESDLGATPDVPV